MHSLVYGIYLLPNPLLGKELVQQVSSMNDDILVSLEVTGGKNVRFLATLDVSSYRNDKGGIPAAATLFYEALDRHDSTLQHVTFNKDMIFRHISKKYYGVRVPSREVDIDWAPDISFETRLSLNASLLFALVRVRHIPRDYWQRSVNFTSKLVESQEKKSRAQRVTSRARYLHDTLSDIHIAYL